MQSIDFSRRTVNQKVQFSSPKRESLSKKSRPRYYYKCQKPLNRLKPHKVTIKRQGYRSQEEWGQRGKMSRVKEDACLLALLIVINCNDLFTCIGGWLVS